MKFSTERQDITERLAAQILNFLSSHDLRAGTHIPAQELADLFKVSRTPVNQALKILSKKEVVTHVQNRGFFITGKIHLSNGKIELGQHDNLTDIYFKIAEDRLSGDLPNQISESALRQRYKISHGQLREVLTRVSREGWAERRPGYGWSFTSMLTTPQALAASYRLRLAIEPAAILEPTFRIEKTTIVRCRTTEQRLLDGAIEVTPPDALYEKGVIFHETIAAASHNTFFVDALKRVNSIRRLLAYKSMVDRSRFYAQSREHIKILNYLEKDDRVSAAAAMRKHLGAVMKNLDKIRATLEH